MELFSCDRRALCAPTLAAGLLLAALAAPAGVLAQYVCPSPLPLPVQPAD